MLGLSAEYGICCFLLMSTKMSAEIRTYHLELQLNVLYGMSNNISLLYFYCQLWMCQEQKYIVVIQA